MIKKGVSIFFTILFMCIMYAPYIIFVVDDSMDTTVFYDLSEEEETESETGKTKDFELFSSFRSVTFSFLEAKVEYGIESQFKTYATPHLNLISPPPELLLM